MNLSLKQPSVSRNHRASSAVHAMRLPRGSPVSFDASTAKPERRHCVCRFKAASADAETAAVEASDVKQVDRSKPLSPNFTVIGAGPAGTLAAMLLAKDGYTVDVYERRARPTLDSVNTSRSYPMAFPPRFIKAVKSTGAKPRVFNNETLQKSMVPVVKDPATGSYKISPTTDWSGYWPNFYLADWPSMMMCLVEEAERLFGDRIRYHFEHDLTSIDFDARVATFKRGDSGDDVMVRYGMMLAADGANSRVRKLMENEPDFDFKVQLSCPYPLKYKVVPTLPVEYRPDWMPANERGAMYSNAMKELKNPFFTTIWQRPFARDYSAMVASFDESWLSTSSSGSGKFTRDALQQASPYLPPQWQEIIAQQLDESPVGNFSFVAQCNKLYVPGVVLMGDAAHAQTSSLGLGATSACGGVMTFLDAVHTSGGDFEKAGADYNRRQLPNSRSMQAMERVMAVTAAKGPKPWWWSFAMAWIVPSMLVGTLLTRVAPKQFPFPMYHYHMLCSTNKSFTRVAVEITVIAVVTYAVLATAFVGVGSAGVAALQSLLTR